MQVSLSSGNTSVPIYKYVITREDDSIVTFDSRGLLVQIKEKNGAVINVSYDASEASGLALDCVREVTDAMGMQELYEQIEQKARKTAEHRILS